MTRERTDYEQWLSHVIMRQEEVGGWKLPVTVNATRLTQVLRALYMAGYGGDDAVELVSHFARPSFQPQTFDALALIGEEEKRLEEVRKAMDFADVVNAGHG